MPDPVVQVPVSQVRPEKPFWQSKRFWFNLLTLGLGVAGTLGTAGIIPASAMAVVNPVGNLVLNQLSDGAKLTAS